MSTKSYRTKRSVLFYVERSFELNKGAFCDESPVQATSPEEALETAKRTHVFGDHPTFAARIVAFELQPERKRVDCAGWSLPVIGLMSGTL